MFLQSHFPFGCSSARRSSATRVDFDPARLLLSLGGAPVESEFSLIAVKVAIAVLLSNVQFRIAWLWLNLCGIAGPWRSRVEMKVGSAGEVLVQHVASGSPVDMTLV